MARLLAIISALLLLGACALPAAAEAGHERGAGSAHVTKRPHAGRRLHGRHPHAARVHHKRDHSHRHQHRKSALRSAHKAQNGVRAAHRSARTRDRRTSGSASKRRVHTQTRATGTCPGEDLTPTVTDLPQVREATLCLVNKQRMLHRLTPLKDAPKLDACAEAHTVSMIEDGYFGHYGPDGDTPVDRMKASGYIHSSGIGYAIGENIAWGTLGLGTPRAIVEAWMASPEHRENILGTRYRESGIGVLPAVPGSLGSGQPGATYTQDFGVILPG